VDALMLNLVNAEKDFKVALPLDDENQFSSPAPER